MLPRKAVALFEAYLEVLLLDCTYKTNKFKMPLLNVVGLTGLDTTFYMAFTFLRGEQEEDHAWALQQLKDHLPVNPKSFITDRELALMNVIGTVLPEVLYIQYLLCQWHIQKNILAKCKRYFQTDPEPAIGSLPITGSSTADPWVEFQRNMTTVIQTRTSKDFEDEWKKDEGDLQVSYLRYTVH